MDKPIKLKNPPLRRVYSLFNADEPTGNLDSTHGDEIMKILSGLHENGATIIMFTHSQTCAEYGSRKINLFDGYVVSENYAEGIQH